MGGTRLGALGSRGIPLDDETTALELLEPGHAACPGCGAALAMRYALKGLGPRTFLVIPASCWSVIAGAWPNSSVRVPVLHVPFETAAAAASGVRAALDARGVEDVVVAAWAGDGGTFDIGFQALSAAAERNEDIIFFCYDNEGYMNTGIQRSSATPRGAWTTTTPTQAPKAEPKKPILEIMTAHGIPYAATATVAYPEDLIAKVRRARRVKGFRFIHILAPCPPGWKHDPSQTLRVTRLAVETGVFPLVEVDGGSWRMTRVPAGLPLREYLKLQGRFAHLMEHEVWELKEAVEARLRAVQARAGVQDNKT